VTLADPGEGISREELQLAARNHGLPLEALRHPITPAGLHYLLVHYDIPAVDTATFRLQVGGNVERELSLTLDEIQARPAAELAVTLECAGNGRALLEPRPISQPWLQEAVGTALWRGTPLRGLLKEAIIRDGSVDIAFAGLDRGVENDEEQRYERSLSIFEAMRAEILLAYEMNGEALPPQHGFPLRLVVPGWYGMASVKWLTEITVLDRPFRGYQQTYAYRVRQEEDEEGEPLARMVPRALMAPPGIPEFNSRRRIVDTGTCLLEGRAWSGSGAIDAVEVSTDDGRTWAAAEIEHDVDSPWAWSAWRLEWEAEPGEYELCCRARDEAGNVQPIEPEWNLGGYANNAVQRVPVTVR
jgi:sulfane dehydrogenase subunit SoxC